MHSLIIKMFDFLKNSIKFLKIVILFCILMLLLYWTQNLINTHWEFLDFITPILSSFVNVGEQISKNSIKLFYATFEFKYAIAGLLMGLVYGFVHLLYVITEKAEETYCDTRRLIKKMEENRFNSSMKNTLKNQQIKIQSYYVYISANIKSNFSNNNFNIDLDKEKKDMARFITEKTAVFPQKFEEGFLYRYDSFDNIDLVLDCLLKVVNSQAPLDYIVCVQTISNSFKDELEDLKTLKNLNIQNKIICLAETKYRYEFNKSQKHTTEQVGLFNDKNKTFEVHEFY